MVSCKQQQKIPKKSTYILSGCQGGEIRSAANNGGSQRNSHTSYQVAEEERHGHLQQQRIPEKFTYMLSGCQGRESWSATNNKESQRNSLTGCQVAKVERHGQLQKTNNRKQIHLQAVKLPRQRDMVSCKQQRIPKKFTYFLLNSQGREPWSAANNRESPKKFTYILSGCQGGEIWSAKNNKEPQRNSLTNCQVAEAQKCGQLQTTNPKEIHLHAVKLPRQT
jgi:hypothetical protein